MSSPRIDELLLLKGGTTHLLWTSVSPEAGKLAFSDNLDALVSTLFEHWRVSSHSCPLTRKSKSRPVSLACLLVERWEREKIKKCSAVLKKFQQSWRGVLEPRSRVRGVLFPRTGLSVLVSLPCSVTGWEQLMGSVTSVPIPWQISEGNNWGSLSIMLPAIIDLRDSFSWLPQCSF